MAKPYCDSHNKDVNNITRSLDFGDLHSDKLLTRTTDFTSGKAHTLASKSLRFERSSCGSLDSGTMHTRATELESGQAFTSP